MSRTLASTSVTAGLVLLAFSGLLALELMLPAATAPLSTVLGPAGRGAADVPSLPMARL